MASTEFETDKEDSVLLLNHASVKPLDLEYAQVQGVLTLLAHLRAELYDLSDGRAAVLTGLVNEVDRAVKRLFE